MIWEWDPDKSRTNLLAHGIEFETAAFVFDDPISATIEDPYPDEQRWRTIGMIEGTLILVIHTWPEVEPATGEETGRIISARPTTTHERRVYEEGHA